MTSSASVISVAEIVRLGSLQARDICMTLFPNGHASHARFVVGSLAGEPGASLSVYLRGPKPGNWMEWNGDLRGDILDLIAHAMSSGCCGDKGKAVAWLKTFLGLDKGHIDIEAIRRKAEQARLRANAAAKKDSAKRRGIAWHIWGIQAAKDWRGTPVERYLQGRAIRTDLLPKCGALRYHPECLLPETGELLPAMVAAVVGPDGKFQAVHRTFLEPVALPASAVVDSNRLYRKASIDEPKRSLGAVLGGHISLHKGASGLSLPNAPDGDICIVAEGIENALTLLPAMPEARCIAAVSLANMASVVMPRSIKTRILVRDAKLMKQEAEQGFARALEFHCAQCADVRVVDFGEHDANAFLMSLKRGEAA